MKRSLLPVVALAMALATSGCPVVGPTGEHPAPVPSSVRSPEPAAPASAASSVSVHPSASASSALGSAPSASAGVLPVPAKVAVSRSDDLPHEGPIFWVHQTAACRAARASGPPPSVGPPKIYPWPSNGRLPIEVVVRILRVNAARLIGCYTASAAGEACTDARASVAFVIDRQGDVSQAEPQPDADPPQDLALATCLAHELRSLTFPAPEGGRVTVRMPLRFLR